MEMTAGRAIVEIWKAEGVKYVFGMPGGHTIGIYDALYDTPEIKHVLIRHEHAAACLAAGYAQLTGEPGICLVTAGPGATNLITAVTEAFVGALPMIIFAGRGAQRTAQKGASQEIDQVTMFGPITKMAVRVDNVSLFPEVVRQAFMVARSGKPGPVLIDMPQDVLGQSLAFEGYVPVGKPPLVRGDVDRIKTAVDLLANAERPLIVTGGGAIAAGAGDAVRRLAESLSIPVLTTLSGRGIIPDDHPLTGGGIGHHRTTVAKEMLPGADVVLGIGDARAVVEEMASAAELRRGGNFRDHPRTKVLAQHVMALEQEADGWGASDQVPLHPIRVIRSARAAFPRDATSVIDVGVLAQGMAGAFPYYKVFEPRATITPSSFYGMGYSACAAPAGPLARPGKPTICFVGDGSFQMMMHVLPVAAELKSAVTWCVLNDGALGSIHDIQRQFFNGRYLGTEFEQQVDFAKIAEACGCHGERVERPQDIDAAFERAKEANGRGVPAVIDFIVAKERLLGSLEFFAR
jgi:acetolactate synthase-1/2/3 large subunit